MRPVFERLCRGCAARRKIAIVGVARRFLIWCWAMMRDDRDWDSRTAFAARLTENNLPDGFMTSHYYSNQEAFTVRFDGTGAVIGVDDGGTMDDLPQTRD